MEETNAGDQPSKPDGDTDQPRSLPYSVETPYGFHLDLDFLKYVDDIEKGNTIRRVHIHRKAKQPKFSTLPRNFSLPENGSRAYAASSNKSWAAFAHRKTSLGAEETIHLVTTNESPPFVTPADEQSYRRKALLAETIRQAEVMRPEEDLASCRGRPQLLRASSMPATLPPTKNVEEESQCSEPSQLVSLPQPCDGKSFTEIPFSPAKESLDSNRPDSLSLNLPKDTRIAQQQMKEAVPQSRQLGEQAKTTPELDHQPEAHPQEGKEVQSPQPSQPATVQELLMVTESGGEESETPTMETFAQLVKDVSSSPKLLDENENHEEIELNINEVMPSISEENEDRNVWARENGEFLGLESSVCHMVEPSTVTALKQHIAVLEEQLSTKTQELEHIRLVLKQQDDEIKEKERNIKTLASSKAQLEEKFCRENTQETKPCEQDGNALPYHDAAVNTELIGMDRLKESQDKGVNVNISVSTKSVGCGVDNMNLEVEKLSKMPIHTDQGLADVHAGIRKKGTAFLDKQKRTGTDIEPAVHTSCFTELQINEHIHDDCQSQRSSYDTESRVAPAPTGESYSGPDLKKGPAEDIKQVLMEEERHTDQQDSSDADPISQYVKKIQELLQEQWMCLEHGYPELASAIKQPASKLSSIQNQLVNSLNLLLSAYSTQASPEKENSNAQYQQLDLSPTTSLKSIMKKKGHGFHAGGNGTKKNLQFVGVNGGYETTSSEDTSCEDSSSEGNSDCETERKYESVAHRQVRAADDRDCASPGIPQCTRHEGEELQEREDPTMASTQHKTDRYKPSEDFLNGCQLLRKHLSEIRTTGDKHLRHVFNSVCQEWFRVSSRKSSSPEIVAVYLREFQAIDPQLLKKIVNLADGNGNTALHYSVSHSNFLIVKLLLDTGVCDVDHQNKAGYTAVMITPLASAETDEDMEVVLKLLKFGNVNIRASQGGQTALMLGVSHDREDMVKALLSCEADINLKDDNGASALMVACQQGNAEIVKLLLAHPECDATLTDKDGNSALSVALKSAHVEIAELLQAHIEQSSSLSK
ncbi:PREDICTED: KN motif and ankyrin repeat domain-containing protein 4 isoform X1 [Crocodylus porosus]|uniref:KN motif and ankyrin repeat domain-containing protein 4 isoform X1 n=1 Tax=Crocodylus porosus TaxID=8502 RepID=UPI00093AE9F7|nr:PREDICTED: KN motif and ankyrin repeat domain-containing protein 4 isoform X1 [Crocodylus porosus]XP_019387094.1 PREDICTED: KN motif and ankyrin repeat domain-containing protein 4 isoform X1 [Crocodylus porosus]